MQKNLRRHKVMSRAQSGSGLWKAKDLKELTLHNGKAQYNGMGGGRGKPFKQNWLEFPDGMRSAGRKTLWYISIPGGFRHELTATGSCFQTYR